MVKAFAGRPGVTYEESARGFASSSLKVGGRIFTMLASGEQFVVRLPKARVGAGRLRPGQRFDPRHSGRLMNEWEVAGGGHEDRWPELAGEAYE